MKNEYRYEILFIAELNAFVVMHTELSKDQQTLAETRQENSRSERNMCYKHVRPNS